MGYQILRIFFPLRKIDYKNSRYRLEEKGGMPGGLRSCGDDSSAARHCGRGWLVGRMTRCMVGVGGILRLQDKNTVYK